MYSDRPPKAGRLDPASLLAISRVSAGGISYVDFARHHQMSPMAYLRRVRLARAHEELLAADPTRGDTVTSIACRRGFPSPSRFAAAYRQACGYSPSTTLHR